MMDASDDIWVFTSIKDMPLHKVAKVVLSIEHGGADVGFENVSDTRALSAHVWTDQIFSAISDAGFLVVPRKPHLRTYNAIRRVLWCLSGDTSIHDDEDIHSYVIECYRAALAPFTESDASLVDSGLRSCATPENEETGR